MAKRRKRTKPDPTIAPIDPIAPVSPSYGRPDALAGLALVLLVAVSYLPAMLWGGFVWDDNLCIEIDPVREVSGLWQIWFSPSDLEHEGHYWPLTYTTFWLEHKLWGFDPAGYHVVNVLLHLANTLLLWHLLRRLAVPGAWVVAAVFAVHPLHVESVAWVMERKDVLSGLFYLLAVLAWMRSVEQASRRLYELSVAWVYRPPRPLWMRFVQSWYVRSLALYVAALLSKSIAITLPAALLLVHWWKQGRVTSTDLFRLVPFLAVGLAFAVGDLSFYWSQGSTSFDYSLTERALIAARALWFYAGKLLWPAELAVIYPRWDIRVADPLAWGYLMAAVALAVALWHFRRTLGRGPLAGALFFALTLSPVLGFVDHGYMQYAFVADRFQYLAGIGFMAVVIGSAAYGVCRLPDWWQKGVLGVVGVVLVALGMLTWRQASIYRDDETFHRHIIALNPQARNAHRHLGNELYYKGQFEDALDAYRVAAEQRPNDSRIPAMMGVAFWDLGRYEEAEQHLRHAIALDPKRANRYFNLGSVLHDSERYEEAVAALEQAVALESSVENAAQLSFYKGRAAHQAGRPEAAEHYMRAIELVPSHAEAFRWLGHLRFEQQRYDEALERLQQFITLAPGDAVAHSNMGVILYNLGRSAEALQHFDQALSLDPTLEEARAKRETLLEVLKGKAE